MPTEAAPIVLPFAGPARLRTWERVGLVIGLLSVVAFGVVTELRSCFQSTRKTDFGVYLRAAWAVRTGGDLYGVTDTNGYHYTYPPTFAILLTPFADAPVGVPRQGLLPYPVSVALWTLLNFLLVARMVHVLAALALPGEWPGSRRWWYARTVPVYLGFGGIFYSIGFGQVNVLLTALLVEMLRGSLRGQRFRGGLWLAAAIALKVMPVFLLLYPLLRRDLRALAGVFAGLAMLLGVVPAASLGVERTAAAYQSFSARVLRPGLLGTNDPQHLRELFNPVVNDNQAILAAIHNNLHPDRSSRPAFASSATRWTHNGLVLLLTLAVCTVLRRRGLETPLDAMIGLGLLMLLMVHAVPMSHMHYYALGLPLLAGLWLRGLAERPGRVFPGWAVLAPLVLWGVGTALPLLPGELFELLRQRGLGLSASLMLMTHAVWQMRPRPAPALVERWNLRRAA